MAAPALRSHVLLDNDGGNAYSRTLKVVTEDEEDSASDADSTDEECDESSSGDASSDDESDEEVVDEVANVGAVAQADIVVAKPEADPTHVAAIQDMAQLQKRQAWLRGGAGGDEEASVDTVETASIRSTPTRRKSRAQPSLLEALFLPKTVAAAARSPATTKANAAVRPHVRRRSTTDVRESTRATRSDTPSRKSPSKSISDVSAKSPPKQNKKKDSRPFSLLFATTPPPKPPAVKIECITCLADDVPIHRSARLKCKHRMCHSCLKRVFTLSTTDPQLMPPKCCTEDMIPLQHVDRLFDMQFKALWNRKFAEYSTKNRIYCPEKSCGAWIKPKNIELDRASGRKKGTCSKCHTKVCKKCGLKWHSGSRECENDDATQSVISLGRESGWQRCWSCRAMVQLAEGCNHMRCRCNAEFCMCCGARWKTCDCPWFNLPPDIGIDGFLVPGQNLPPPRPPPPGLFHPAPLGQRIGDLPLPPPPPGGLDDIWRHLPPPGTFRDRRDEPLDPLNPGDIFATPPNLDRLRSGRRRRTAPPDLYASSREQEAADEALARQLQEQELTDAGVADDGGDAARRRASRRARRTVYAITGDDDIYELGGDADERLVRRGTGT